MAESELDKAVAKAFRAAFWLMVIHALMFGLVVVVVCIAMCLFALCFVRPSESRNNNVQMQTAPRTFDDNVQAVLKKQGYVE